MYIIKNALQNITRNKGRNIGIAGIILVIILCAVIALMTGNTASNVIDDYQQKFGSEVTFSPDMQKVIEQAQSNSSEDGGRIRIQVPQISADNLIAFAESEYLKEALFTADARANSSELIAIDEDKGGMSSIITTSISRAPGGANGANGTNGEVDSEEIEDEEPPKQFYHKLMGGSFTEFEDGTRSLVEGGAFPENEDECIISKELAENSSLSVGDIITVTSDLTEGLGSTDTTEISWNLTITGIYEDLTEEYSSPMENAYFNRRNEILTSFATIQKNMIEGLTGINVTSKYYLKNPDMLEAFTAEVYEKGLSDMYNVQTDEQSYNTIVKPVKALKNFSNAFIIIVLILGGVILALLSSIAIRERKYEIGVLRAVGMKKIKIIAGLFTENFVITSFCLIIGLGVGLIAAQPIADVMIKNQVSAAEENSTPGNIQGGIRQGIGDNASSGGGGGGGRNFTGGNAMMGAFGSNFLNNNNAQPLEEMKVSLSIVTILEIIALAIFLTTFATMLSAVKITRYEPIKILMNRN